jgi:hypothetical protein
MAACQGPAVEIHPRSSDQFGTAATPASSRTGAAANMPSAPCPRAAKRTQRSCHRAAWRRSAPGLIAPRRPGCRKPWSGARLPCAAAIRAGPGPQVARHAGTQRDSAAGRREAGMLAKKMEHHGGDHAVRIVPICPELRAIFADAFDRVEPGATFVVPSAARASVNLRTHLERIITKAGHTPWPRLLQNLRASCETDWVEKYPAHVVAPWLGHSPKGRGPAPPHVPRAPPAAVRSDGRRHRRDRGWRSLSGRMLCTKRAQCCAAGARTGSH